MEQLNKAYKDYSRTVLFLVLFLFLVGCLPWQSPEEPPEPPSEPPLTKANKEIKTNHEIGAKNPVSKIKQQPLQLSRIPSSGSFIEVIATITHPATILGKNGFSPAELTIEVGDSITWTNADPQKKTLVLTFQRVNTREFVTSPSLQPGREWDYAFTEPGEYIYWTVGYGVKGRLVVKESLS